MEKESVLLSTFSVEVSEQSLWHNIAFLYGQIWAHNGNAIYPGQDPEALNTPIVTHLQCD